MHIHLLNGALMKFAKTLLAICGFAAITVAAQTFPAKPLSLMVPYPAGGVSDVIARLVNNPLGKELGQPVLVENLGGAGGAIAAQKVLTAPSDGYYVFQGSPNELILAPLANAAVKFKSEDFRMIHMISVNPLVILARPDLPANSADELAAYAIKAAKDGKPLTYASVGTGSFYHMMGEQMSKVLGVPMTHVPYKGGAPIYQDLGGSQVDIFITPYGAPQVEMTKAGRMKFVAALSPQRQRLIPNVPTVNESKALKGFNFDIWTGYFVKKDTPEAIVKILHSAIQATLTDTAVKTNLMVMGAEVASAQSLEGASKSYADGIVQMKAIAKSINLQPQ
jgi:tripartite-type tricarboxylate transporter receptor subunit TctC